MSEKQEELIAQPINDKLNSASSINRSSKSKRTIKLPFQVTEKKKEETKPINNIISIESLKNRNTISPKSKRTLRLNLGTEEINDSINNVTDDTVTDSNLEIDDTSIQTPENNVLEDVPQTVENEKSLLFNSLLDTKSESFITPPGLVKNSTFLEAPSVFEKFDISINNKSSQPPTTMSSNTEPVINLGSSFFYEPSVFQKFNIEITDENEVHNAETNAEAPKSLNDLISYDNENETVEKVSTASNTEKAVNVEENSTSSNTVKNVKSKIINTNVNNKRINNRINNNRINAEKIINNTLRTLIEKNNASNTIINELINRSNNSKILDLLEKNNSTLKEVANSLNAPEKNIITPVNPVSIPVQVQAPAPAPAPTLAPTPVAVPQKKKAISQKAMAVFKKFSYDEAAGLEETEEELVDEIPFNSVSDINQVLNPIETKQKEIDITKLDVAAEPIGISVPTIDTSIDTSNNYISDDDFNTLNILSPENNTSDLTDDELLDLLGNNSFDDTSLENDENFSLEDYFGIEDYTSPDEDDELNNKFYDFENDIYELYDDNADIEFDEELSSIIPELSNIVSETEDIVYEPEDDIDEQLDDDILEEISEDDITLDDIDLEDLSSLTISDIINEDNVEEIANTDTEVNNDIDLNNIDINDLDLNDIDLTDVDINSLEVDDTVPPLADEEDSSNFLEVINSLSKAISDLEENSFKNSIEQEKYIATPPANDDGKAFNILINKDDIFSISILNETYEIITDFDGISVLSENVHISTPKNHFFLRVGDKHIEIHNHKTYFLVYTNFEDVEFANAINNVVFAKKNNRTELNIKAAFKLSSTNNILTLSMLNSTIANISATQEDSNNEANKNENSICDNNTLVISEETQKVYLPYTIAEVMEKLNDTSKGYQTINEVIENEYTLPLSDFKMPIISRFREAYKFMRQKEKSSVYAALDLALELMFNSNLNPAIIRASKNLKELNIYLDCLYENELDKFDCFKIIYKVLPKVK